MNAVSKAALETELAELGQSKRIKSTSYLLTDQQTEANDAEGREDRVRRLATVSLKTVKVRCADFPGF